MSQTAYRYIDGEGAVPKHDYMYQNAEIQLIEYDIIRWTANGFVIKDSTNSRGTRFVNSHAKCLFACDNKKEAMDNFILRKERERKIVQAKLDYIDKVLERANDGR